MAFHYLLNAPLLDPHQAEYLSFRMLYVELKKKKIKKRKVLSLSIRWADSPLRNTGKLQLFHVSNSDADTSLAVLRSLEQ